MKTKSLILASVLILSASLTLFASCKRATAASTNTSALPPQLMEAVTVTQKVAHPTIESIGKAKPHKDLLVSVEMSGKLVTTPFNVGDNVTKGQLLARVRTLGLWSQRSVARSNINLVNTSLKQSTRDLADIKALYQKGVVSKNNYDMAKLKVDTETAQLRSAKATYGQINDTIGGTSVIAPFSGEVAMKNYEEGTFVMTGTPLLRVVDLSSIKVTVGLTELDVSSFKSGDKVTVSAIAWPGKTWAGTIFSISPSADARSGLFPVEVLIANSADGGKVKGKTTARWMIREGMTMKVVFPRQEISGFFIPAQAVIERNGLKSVWKTSAPKGKRVLIGNNSSQLPVVGVKLVTVKLGQLFEGWYKIEGGLQSGDKVVTTGVSKLRSDSIIRVKRAKEFGSR
ncbi:efflux RND transporter periplasmic adaptor subunit [Myxococcota bacterium]|nr:efflux RND transporter periplasmic adaptor subunit [Myxococcota bacterium]